MKQGVALTVRNTTGPPCSVGRPTVHAPDGRPARPPAALQTTTTDDSQQNNTGPLGRSTLTVVVISTHLMAHFRESNTYIYNYVAYFCFISWILGLWAAKMRRGRTSCIRSSKVFCPFVSSLSITLVHYVTTVSNTSYLFTSLLKCVN